MKKIIIVMLGFVVCGCATNRKCQSLETRENSVIDSRSCQVYVRGGLYLDQVSPSIADKIKEGKQIKYNWIPAKTVGQILIPAHAEVEISEGD